MGKWINGSDLDSYIYVYQVPAFVIIDLCDFFLSTVYRRNWVSAMTYDLKQPGTAVKGSVRLFGYYLEICVISGH